MKNRKFDNAVILDGAVYTLTLQQGNYGCSNLKNPCQLCELREKCITHEYCTMLGATTDQYFEWSGAIEYTAREKLVIITPF